MREFRLAFQISWIAVSVVTMATVLAPYVLSADRIARLTPQCERKTRSGAECFFCGMTTAFIHIAHGRIVDAGQANRGALPLYGGFVCNGLSLTLVLAKSRRPRNTGC